MKKDTGIAYLLFFFLGGFGAHRYYTNNIGTAIMQTALAILGIFSWFAVVAAVFQAAQKAWVSVLLQ